MKTKEKTTSMNVKGAKFAKTLNTYTTIALKYRI